MIDSFIGSGASLWEHWPAAMAAKVALARAIDHAHGVRSRPGQMARLHLIEPPEWSPRAQAAKSDCARVKSYFVARKLGMTPAQIIATRTRAADRHKHDWQPSPLIDRCTICGEERA